MVGHHIRLNRMHPDKTIYRKCTDLPKWYIGLRLPTQSAPTIFPEFGNSFSSIQEKPQNIQLEMDYITFFCQQSKDI